MATELAKAYVQIIPSAQGMQESITNVMNGEGASAGENSGKGFAASFGSAAKKALVGLGIGKIIADGISNASEFETAMAKTSTLFSGTTEEFDALKGTILNLSSTYGMSASMLAEAAYSAESASVPMEQLGPMLESSAKLATAGFTDIDTALSATAKTMNAYGDAAMSADEIQKVLIQTQNLGITTVGELGASLANVTPTAAAMGVSFDQVGAALAQMTAQGVPTAQATTQLRSAMTELGKAGTKADEAFRKATEGTKYAGMGFKEAMAKGANLGDVFGMMQAYADASGVSMVDLWGSVEAGNAAMMIASDVDKFNSNLKQMSTSTDVVDEAYGKMANTLGNSMNRLKESATNFITTLFQGGDISTSFDNMLASVGDISKQLIPWLETGLKTLGENLPQLVSSLMDFGASMLDALGKVDWIDLGTTIINGIIGALGELGTRLAGLFGGAVTAVTSGEVDFGSIGSAIWNGVTGIITTAGGWLKTLFETAVGTVTGGGIDFGSIGSAILSGITGFLDNAGNFLSNLFKTGKEAVTDGTTIDWNEVGQAVLNGLSSAVDMAGHFLEGAFQAGSALVKAIDWETVGTTIGNAVNGTIDTAGAFLSGCFDTAKATIEQIDWKNIGTVIGDAVNGTIDTAGVFLSGCFDTAKATIEQIDWQNIGAVIGDAVNGTIDTAGAFLSGCFDTAKATIEQIDWKNIGTVIGDAVNGTIDTAGAFLSGSFDAAKTAIEQINWKNIGTVISDAVNGTVDTAGEFLSGGFTAAHAAIKSIKWDEIGETLGNTFSVITKATGETLAAPFEAAFGILKGINWNEVGSAMQSGIGDVWSGLTGFLGGLLGGAGESLQGIGSGIGAAAEGLGQAIGNLFSGNDAKKSADELKKAMSDLEQAIKDGETSIETTAKGIGTTIKNAIEGIGWTGVGQNIVSGIIGGINSMAWMLVSRMTELATEALDAAKTALGISSPSRVMRDSVGRWIPEGIAMGITENGDVVEAAMSELAARTATTDLAGDLAAQGRGFGTIAGDPSGSETEGGLFGRIAAAIREGMQSADIALYLDGQKVSERVNEYLGDEMEVRNLV